VWGQEGWRLASGTFPRQKINNEGSLSSSYTKPLPHQPASSRTLVDCHTQSTLENIIPFKASSEREYGSLLRVWCEETNFLAEWL